MRVGATVIIAATVLAASPSDAVIESLVPAVAGSLLLTQGGNELEKSIGQARAAGEALIDRADQRAEERLNQLDTIVQTTLQDIERLTDKSEEAVLRILEQAKKDVDQIRIETMADLKEVIWEAECSGKRLLIEDVPTALGGLGRFLNVNQFELTPPVYLLDRPTTRLAKLFRDDPYIIDIKTPFDQTYIEVRNLMEDSISESVVNDETSVHSIVSTWEYLAAFALKTSCFFPGSSDRWNQEFVNYREQAKAWRDLVFIRIE